MVRILSEDKSNWVSDLKKNISNLDKSSISDINTIIDKIKESNDNVENLLGELVDMGSVAPELIDKFADELLGPAKKVNAVLDEIKKIIASVMTLKMSK